MASADLGPLGPLAQILGTAPQQPVSNPPVLPASAAVAAAAPTTSEGPAVTKQGRTAAESPATSLSAAAAEGTPAFWPLVGRFNVREHDRRREVDACLVPGFFWPACTFIKRTIVEEKAELQHQIVWTREVLEGFDDRADGYEHNVKVRSPGRSGTRPACNPFSEDNFYVRSETSKFTTHNIPGAAQLYNDTATFSDPCSDNEVTFGIVHPEKLDDDVPSGKLPFFSVKQESDRNDDADRSFNLNAQTLSRDNAGCDRLPLPIKQNCIGIDVDDTRTAVLARTGGTTLPDVELPACVVWKWPPVGSEQDSPTLLKHCGGDRDGDGWDDSIDCAPSDPRVNPGAVDIPNDGIDQNCDGRDLVVGSGVIQVTMVWNNDNDMDLHVTEPGGREIWYASPGPSATGGRLDRDDNVFVCNRDSEPGGVENVYWPTGASPARGTYTVEVVEYARCSAMADWSLEVRIDGVLVRQQAGTGVGQLTFTY